MAFALSPPAGPSWPFLVMEPLAMISGTSWYDLFKQNCRCTANAGVYLTNRDSPHWCLLDLTGLYWFALVCTSSHWFVLVITNSHHVRIAFHRIRIDAPSPPYCFVLHRIVTALKRIASYCYRIETYCIV